MTRQPILHRLCYMIARSDITAIRLMLALGAVFWSGVLFWSGDIFSRDAGTYGVMARMGDEYLWGSLFLLQGLSALRTLFFDTRTVLLLLTDAALGCILWTAATLALFASRLHEINVTIGMSGELVFMIASWLHFVRLWIELEDARE